METHPACPSPPAPPGAFTHGMATKRDLTVPLMATNSEQTGSHPWGGSVGAEKPTHRGG